MKLNEINTDFLAILAAKQAGDWTVVNESSLSRAYQHAANGHFGIITNHRAGRPAQENRSGFYQLKETLRSNGLGGITLVGHWRECDDPSVAYDQCPPDQLRDVTEPSLFVPNIPLDLLKKLIGRYDQDAAVYCGPETGKQVVLVFRDGGTQPIGSFHPGRISRAYSELPGRKGTFVFEYRAQSQVETMIESNFDRHGS